MTMHLLHSIVTCLLPFMALFLYLGKTLLIAACLYAYYIFFQRDRGYHLYNRYFLLAVPLVSLTLPLIPFSIGSLMHSDPVQSPVKLIYMLSDTRWADETLLPVHTSSVQMTGTGWTEALPYLYFAIAGLVAWPLFRSAWLIRRMGRRLPSEKRGPVRIYWTHEAGTPFSFFRRIFWNSRLDPESKAGRQVWDHELCHVRQWHSLDTLYLETMRIFCWFNPFFHLILREARAVHEFLADEAAAKDRFGYATLLVQETLLTRRLQAVHSFYRHPIKRRIALITGGGKNRFNLLSRVFALPLLGVLFCVFTEGYTPARSGTLPRAQVTRDYMVIIDAGHGGFDPGALAKDGIMEKDITLKLATRIKELGGQYGIKVLLTRSSDELPGNRSDRRESLRYRTEMANRSGADLFVSIHVNNDSANASRSGFDIFVSQDNDHFPQSVRLGSLLASSLRNTYPISDTLRQSQGTHIWVLRASAMPAALIECGYISNPRDEAFITNPANQEKVARSILEGIVQYQQPASGKQSPVQAVSE